MINDISLALVVHVLAAAGIIAGAAIQIAAGFRIRGAATGEMLASWASFARSASMVIAGSMLVSLLTGGHLAARIYADIPENGFAQPFVSVGLAAWLLLLPVGLMIGGPRFKQFTIEGEELGASPLPPATLAAARSGQLWGAVHSMVGLAAGFIWIMQLQPGLAHTVAALLGGMVIGWGSGVLLAGRDAPDGGFPTVPGPAATPPS